MIRSVLKQMIVVCGFLSCLQVATEAKAYYASHQGRFINRDPIEYVDGQNLYAGYFAPNNTDSTGEAIDTLTGTIEACLKAPTYEAKMLCLEAVLDLTVKKNVVNAAICALIHSQYHPIKCGTCGNLDKCKATDRAKAAATASCLATEIALRSAYLAKKCDYLLPGSITSKEGSKGKERNHRIRVAIQTAELNTCLLRSIP